MFGCVRPPLWSPSPRYEQNDWAPPCSVRRFSRADIRRFRLVFHVSDLIDDFGVGQRRDVAFILVVRDRPEHAAHDLAGTGLRHVRHDHDTARAGNGPDLTDHGLLYSLADVLARLVPGLQRYVEVRDLAFDLVSGGDHGCLRRPPLRADLPTRSPS